MRSRLASGRCLQRSDHCRHDPALTYVPEERRRRRIGISQQCLGLSDLVGHQSGESGLAGTATQDALSDRYAQATHGSGRDRRRPPTSVAQLSSGVVGLAGLEPGTSSLSGTFAGCVHAGPARNGWGPGAKEALRPPARSPLFAGASNRHHLPTVGRPAPLFLPGRFAEPVLAPGAIADSMPEGKKAEGSRACPERG